MSQLQLSLLGTPIIKHGEHTLTFSTRKALALLAYLAVEGGMHTRKALSEAFWPELDAEHGRAALRATLLELRRLLERAHGPDEQSHLWVERDMLALDQNNPPFLDLYLVEAASKQTGEAHTHECNTLVKEQFEQAMRMARGPFLASFTLRDSQFFDDWARQQREYWHLRTQHLFERLSHLYEQAGEREQAIGVVTRWLRFDPLSEEGYRRQMRLRFALGDRVGALRAYATCRAVLVDELQIEPEPETMALAKHLRHTTPFHSSPSRPPHPSSRQESTHLLDGPLIGRSTEFRTLIDRYQHVHTGQPHLVLLQGESGIGKTRLANEFVRWAQAQGANVLAGQVLQTERQLPYQPFIDILRHRLEQGQIPKEPISAVWLTELVRLLPELHDHFSNLPIPWIDEEFGHHRLFEAITRIVRHWAAHHPLVLLLDDMQWADTGTLDLLLYLAHSLAEQPESVLLLLNLRTGTELRNQQTTWLQALKRTRIPLTTQALAAFTKEETQQFVQALAWAEQPLRVENCRSNEKDLDNGRFFSTCREELMCFNHWLYVQTQGQPFYLVELLKGLLEREIILPSLQENGRWGLVLKRELLAETPTGELIPVSVRELIGSQLSQLTSPARAFLVAAAVLERDLTFERLCSVARVDELTGLQALEELVQSGLLCEEKCVEEVQALDGYRFPGEMIREVVCQKAGTTRQRLMQQRVNAIVIPLEDAPTGYKKFDQGAAQKFVLNPNGLIPA
jgi:DNA-binding SARP family transcriptional activator